MINTKALLCPICSNPFIISGKQLICSTGHSFDIAREGYVNLLIGRRPGTNHGDNEMMTRARNRFLSAGYYEPLALALSNIEKEYCPENGRSIDICCGEGWYSFVLSKLNPNVNRFGFDISRDMVRIAAKRNCSTCFVANISSIPIKTDSIDFGMHLFAPFQEEEFHRILSPEGTLVTCFPGKNHLLGLKRLLYKSPYLNDEKSPSYTRFKVIKQERVNFSISINDNSTLTDLFYMTPYAYHTPLESIEKIKNEKELETECSFILQILKKN